MKSSASDLDLKHNNHCCVFCKFSFSDISLLLVLNQECYFFLLSVIIIVIKKINFHLKLMAELQIHLVLDCFSA